MKIVLIKYNIFFKESEFFLNKFYEATASVVWQAALYPRIIQQKMYSVDTQNQNVSSAYKIYEALWNIDVAVYPVSSGTCNNLVGDLLISYM